MPSNKNQHFVPRCHLRPFTKDGAKQAINLFNIDRVQFVENAALKSQCSRDYFYGTDQLLENALRAMEDGYGRLMLEIVNPTYRLLDAHRVLLRRFWLLQHLRTEAVSLRIIEMQEAVRATLGPSLEEFGSTIREAVVMAMQIFAKEMEIVDDLKVCLIRNRTGMSFVTSDNPAVMTNRWYLTDRRTQGASPGLHSAGALMLLPLSPRILCLMYDGDIYSVPHTDGWVEVKHKADIRAFNQHQFLNCLSNIYFRDWDSREGIHQDFNAVASSRPAARHQIHYAVYEGDEGQWETFRVVNRPGRPSDGRGLIRSAIITAKPTTWPRQVGWRAKGAAYWNGTGVGYIRHGTICRQRSVGFKKVVAR